MKILIPNFLTYVKCIKENGEEEIKPLYALNEEELKKYKSKNDESVVFYDQKLTNFKIGNVFDAGQTDMNLENIECLLNPLLEGELDEHMTDTFIQAIYKDGFKVKNKESKTSGKGNCDFNTNTIFVARGLSDVMRLKVIIHEYAHALAHQHLKDNYKEYQEHREQYEAEAESIAYVVTKFLGLDTSQYSQMYLYSWSKNKDFKEIDDSFNTIINYSKRILKNYKEIYEKNFGLYSGYYEGIGI